MSLTTRIANDSQEQELVKPVPFMWANFVEAADELESLFLYGPSVTAVLGADGVGKTRLIDYLQHESDNVILIRINANPLLSVAQLMLMISEQLFLLKPSEDPVAIHHHLQKSAKDHPVIFLVDDAHHLSLELMKVLLSFLGEIKQVPEVPIRLFAFVANRFNDRLIFDETGMIDKNSLYKLTLTGFLQSEMTSYLGYQLKLSEENIENKLGEDKLNKLWDASMGNSAKLQQALKQMLIEPLVSKQKKFNIQEINSNVFFRASLALLGLSLLVIAFWGTQRSSTNEKAPLATDAAQVVANKIPEKEPEEKDSTHSVDDKLAQGDSARSIAQPRVQEIANAPQFQKSLKDIEDKPSDNHSTEERVNSHPVPPVPYNEAYDEVTDMASKLDMAPKELPITRDESEVYAESVNDALPKPLTQALQKENTAKQATNDNQNAESKTKKTDKPQLADTIKIFELTEDEKWLMDRDPTHFTIQIVGLRHPAEMSEYIRPFKKYGQFYVYQRVLKGESWYFLVTGDYHNADLARDALKKLPLALQKAKPWIKTFAVVQGQITREK